ncbi:MAG: hypothetical protein F4029_05325 [Gammaproteobacteria bacterium]|nr:hypothetical protein [Gammaproteobacteria bacterium]MYF27761.1 hypothetical protein [Gammaproteobacteria bacterium]MYK45630.1 hypothetical protein [Gammaproteobacteria bacterium]
MKVSVKELAEFVHRRGDIHAQAQSATLAQEGIARQKSYQAERAETYLREHRVAASFGELAISGRIDGWDPRTRVVEEIKTTRTDPNELHARAGDVHEAQLRLYGSMLVLADEALTELRLRLVYLHPAKPDEVVFEETAERADLIGYFETTCAIYAAWIAGFRARVRDRNRQLAGLAFPYGEFRADQRRVAKHLYRAFRDGADWLVEAPTGSGKTMAGLFAALKAIGQGELDRLVFLTSRTTGQRAIEEALTDAVDGLEADPAMTAVTVTARDRICFGEGPSCNRTECSFARGYYERMPAARRQLLRRRLIRRDEVESVAREHRVCPFELTLDVAAWSDIVVCDYNYVFDPIVRLARLENPLFPRVALIVDEAHQLGERVRDMLGSCFHRRSVKAALKESGVPEPLARGFRAIDRAFAGLGSDSNDDSEIPKPAALLRAIERLLGTALEAEVDGERCPAAASAGFEAFQFAHLAENAADGTCHYTSRGIGPDMVVELVCTIPGEHIRACMSRFHGSARVSGSLTPAAVFQQIHGASNADDVLISNGCFPPEHFGVFVVTDISTYYRDRERTLTAVANLIQRVCTQTTGNYLVALPSFEYADAVSTAVEGVDIRCQQAGMTLDEREAFIRWMSEPNAGRVGFVVMGGVFGESVDFRDGTLDGIIVVGAGLPPRSLKRDLIAADAQAAGLGADGDEIAYRQPAMTRVVQAAGRVVRSASERGIAVLVDPRFSNATYRAFLPSRWMIRNVASNQVADAIGEFWFGPRETANSRTREAAC